MVGSALPEQTLVEITGPASVVERIKRVEASVDISGITGTVVRKCKLKLMNSDGDEIDGTYLDYIGKDEEFEVTVTTLNTKLVGISFDVSQVAPEGYGLSSISYKPETVTIAGLKSVISSIYNLNIPASALNPDKNVGKIEQIVDISQYLPEGVSIPDADDCEVAVTMEIVEYETKIYEILPGDIFFANIQEGLALDASEMPAVEISVSAIPQQLESLNVQDIELTVNLEDCKKEGVYTVPVQATLPSGYQYTPFVISVSLVELEEN